MSFGLRRAKQSVHPQMRHESTDPVNNDDEVDVTYMLDVTVFMPPNLPEVWIERREVERVVLLLVLQQEIQL